MQVRVCFSNRLGSANRAVAPVTAAFIVTAALCLLGCQSDGVRTPKTVNEKGRSPHYGSAHTPPDAFDASAGKPPTAATMYSLARILAARGNTTRCIGLLRNLIQTYPDCAPAYNLLAEQYLAIDRPDDAIATLHAGAKRHPNDAVLLNNLGMAHFLQDDYASALTYFDRASAARPDEPTYRANKAAALGMLGETSKAAALYRKDLRPSDVHENVEVLNRARRAAAAQAQARRAAATAPADVQQ